MAQKTSSLSGNCIKGYTIFCKKSNSSKKALGAQLLGLVLMEVFGQGDESGAEKGEVDKGIGEYHMEDDFIDDEEFANFIESDRRENRFGGFFINKVRSQDELSFLDLLCRGSCEIESQEICLLMRGIQQTSLGNANAIFDTSVLHTESIQCCVASY